MVGVVVCFGLFLVACSAKNEISPTSAAQNLFNPSPFLVGTLSPNLISRATTLVNSRDALPDYIVVQPAPRASVLFTKCIDIVILPAKLWKPGDTAASLDRQIRASFQISINATQVAVAPNLVGSYLTLNEI
jgi:hypothetical protein